MEHEETLEGFSGALLIGIDSFSSFHIKFRIIALTIPIGVIFIMSSLIDGSWSHSDTTRFGFSDHCFIGSPFACCESFEDFLGYKPGWLKATIAFISLALIFSLVAVFLVVRVMCVPKYRKQTHIMMHRVIPIICFITALMLLISICVISSKHHTEPWSEQNQVSSAFVVAIFGLIVFTLDGLILLFISQNSVQDTIYPPDYWTKFTKTSTIKDWLNLNQSGDKKVEIVDASKQEKEAVKQLVEKTWKSNLAGMGKDAMASGYKKMEVIDVKRIENPTVYEKYAENRQKLLRRVKKADRTLKRLEEKEGCSPIVTTAHLPTSANLFYDTYTEINEHYLFHGADNTIIEFIAQDGFDTRLANNGMMGRGTYAAECPTKSDQYTGTDLNNRKMILLRMLLGDMYISKAPFQFKRPPCKTCVKNNQMKESCNDSLHRGKEDWMFDSVVAAIPHKHREFIVYDQHMCYPEYIITYNRI